MSGWLSIIVLLASVAGQKAPTTPKPRPILADAGTPGVDPLTVSGMSATPTTITFTGADPDSPTDAGSSTATVTFRANNHGRTWNLTVRSGAAAFTNCATVPISAVTVTCATATNNGNGTGTCGAPFALSTTAHPVASGNEATINTVTYTVTINFTLTDSWKYIAQTSPQCSLSMTYTATAN